MNRTRIAVSAMALLAGIVTLTPAIEAQLTCYPSYVTLSGTCPDSCGRGPDCPCETCKAVA